VFNKYYQDELAYLRELGREFSQAYPMLAPMLSDRGADPDVERLLEGVAFLTGRIRQKLDDEIPEVIHSLAHLLFPHLLRPLPSATIVEISPIAAALKEKRVVAAGTEFASVPVDGVSCRFRSVVACELLPWAVEDVRLEAVAGGKQLLRVEIKGTAGITLGQIGAERLRLHMAGELREALGLVLGMFHLAEEVLLVGPSGKEVRLGTKALQWVGFEESEALLPFGKSALPGLRLLEEYYVLPQKFAFVDVRGLERLQELGKELSRFSLQVRFRAPMRDVVRVSKQSVRLHCVPVVNVFETSSEPIRLSPTRERYVVRPAGLTSAQAQVYAVTRVETIARATNKRTVIPSFYEFSHAGDAVHSFYTTHLVPSVTGEGADVHIAFGTPEDSGVMAEADVASIDLLATNRTLAGALRPGEVSVPTQSSPAFVTFQNISPVTPEVAPPIGQDLPWRVVAHLAMGLRSLTEPEILRMALDVYNMHARVDRQAARANELRTQAVRDIRVTPSERLFRGAIVRGVAIQVELDEDGFSGEGDMYLFAGVLDRLFASYVSINSFARTTIVGKKTRVEYVWPARSGDVTLL
jgi:type VI secretion system protein ImpG